MAQAKTGGNSGNKNFHPDSSRRNVTDLACPFIGHHRFLNQSSKKPLTMHQSGD
jgi:hypothetical protein